MSFGVSASLHIFSTQFETKKNSWGLLTIGKRKEREKKELKSEKSQKAFRGHSQCVQCIFPSDVSCQIYFRFQAWHAAYELLCPTCHHNVIRTEREKSFSVLGNRLKWFQDLFFNEYLILEKEKIGWSQHHSLTFEVILGESQQGYQFKNLSPWQMELSKRHS